MNETWIRLIYRMDLANIPSQIPLPCVLSMLIPENMRHSGEECSYILFSELHRRVNNES